MHRRPRVTAVTGTNGKTTTTYLVESIVRAAGGTPGVVGTVDYRWGRQRIPASLTTPTPPQLQLLLAAMRQDGVSHVALEASSIGLVEGRLDDLDISVAVFTNFTQDHLDYHADMERYFEAKSRLFALLDRSARAGARLPCAVVNVDDPHAERVLERLRSRVVTFGLNAPADVTARDVTTSLHGTRFTLVVRGRGHPLRIKLVGMHNVANALGAAAVGLAYSFPIKRIIEGLTRARSAPGRLERIPAGGADARRDCKFTVFVDYAHTPDALRAVLVALRPLTRGRLITVFGCGGDRDALKRPMMGDTATRLSDLVVLTSDNPRGESPREIIREIEAGIQTGSGDYEVVIERRRAIARALGRALHGDIVLIAGKGHETYQAVRGRRIPFDDREVVGAWRSPSAALQRRGAF